MSEDTVAAIDLTQSVAFQALDRVVQDLADGLDHPELWPLLRETVDSSEHVQLLDILRALRPAQGADVTKLFDLIEAVVVALADPAAGMARLRRLEADNGLSTQIAGAVFYVINATAGDRPANLEGKFCNRPFEKFETLIDGTVTSCCSIWTQKRLGRLENQRFEEIWNSRDAQEMRASILDGSFRHCNKQRCPYIADAALPDRADVTDPRLRTIIAEHRVVLEDKPKWLALAHDWTCNLACPSCRDKLLSADENQERRFAIVEENVFHPLLESEDQIRVSISGQGDPWSSQHYRSLLRHLAEHDLNVQLDICTNALLMSPQRWEQFSGLEKYPLRVNVSIDACSPWVYQAVRFPGKLEKLEPNLNFIGEMRRDGRLFAFQLNATVQLDNYHEIGDLIDYARKFGADDVLLYSIQNTGDHLSGDYARKNVADPNHPLYAAFCESLRDPRLADPIAHPYDIAAMRERALATELPSDRADMSSVATALSEIASAEAERRHAICVALAAAAKVRFGDHAAILLKEADALTQLGFPAQASYRKHMAARVAPALVPDIEQQPRARVEGIGFTS